MGNFVRFVAQFAVIGGIVVGAFFTGRASVDTSLRMTEGPAYCVEVESHHSVYDQATGAYDGTSTVTYEGDCFVQRHGDE